MDSEVLVEYDAANKRMHSVMGGTLAGGMMGLGDGDVEYYLIGNTGYTKVSGYYEEDYWVKEDLEGAWPELDEQTIVEFFDYVEGSVVGEESKNGEATYKLSVEPDMRKIIMYGIEQSGISEEGVSEAEINEAVDMLVKSVKEMEFFVWVTKDGYLPIAVEGQAVISLDVGALYGGMMGGNLDISIGVDLTVDYSPLEIVLPEAALSAQGIDVFYDDLDYDTGLDYDFEEVCGDDWCDWNEDSVSCPEDCYCGDDWCDPSEDETICPEDCAAVCGDGWCDLEENESTCLADCNFDF